MKLSTLLLALVAIATTEGRRPTFAQTNNKAVLNLRGGAGPIDPKTLCQVTSGLCIIEGARATLGPKQCIAAYGVPDDLNDDIQQYHIKNLGTGTLSLGIMLYMMFVNDQPLTAAVRASNLLWAYENTRNILSGDALRGGYASTNGQKIAVAIFLFAVYAMGQDYADTVIKVTSAFWFLCGVQCVLAPESAGKAWKFDKITERTKDNAREFGAFLLSTAMFSGSQVMFPETTPIQAAGYSALPWLFVMVKYFLDGTYAKYGVNQVPIVLWALYQGLVVVTTLF